MPLTFIILNRGEIAVFLPVLHDRGGERVSYARQQSKLGLICGVYIQLFARQKLPLRGLGIAAGHHSFLGRMTGAYSSPAAA